MKELVEEFIDGSDPGKVMERLKAQIEYPEDID